MFEVLEFGLDADHMHVLLAAKDKCEVAAIILSADILVNLEKYLTSGPGEVLLLKPKIQYEAAFKNGKYTFVKNASCNCAPMLDVLFDESKAVWSIVHLDKAKTIQFGTRAEVDAQFDLVVHSFRAYA